MSAYIVDTETTGEEPLPEVIELAVAKLEPNLDFTAFFAGRFKPQGRVKFSAMAVHHILPEELKDCPDSALAKAQLPTDMEYMIGHNVDYDWKALGEPACKRICTLAISRRIWPGNDGHSLTTLCYQLATDLQAIRSAVRGAHGATADVELLYSVLRAMLEQPQLRSALENEHARSAWEELWLFSEDARIPRIWTFGKHKDKYICETDRGYLLWCLKQGDMDPYVHVACRKALAGELGQ